MSVGSCRDRAGLLYPAIAVLLLAAAVVPASAQDKPPPLSPRAQAADANGNGVIDRDEAGGPLAANFDEMDCDRNDALDGNEIRAFFTGAGCKSLAAASGGSAPAQAKAPPPLSARAKAADANGNGVIDRDEAGGPLAANFDEMDCDKSNALDGNEIRAFFSGAGCKSLAAAGKPETAAPSRNRPRSGGRPPATVTLDDVIAEPLAKTVPVIGRLVARQSGVVASQVRGAVAEVRVDVGDRVERGQIVAVLVGGRMKAARDRAGASVARFRGVVAAAEAEYRKKRDELKRLDRLRKSAAFSRARYQDLQRDVQSRQGALADRRGQLQEARARLREAELDLADTRIKAPFPGVVTEKHIDIGTYLNVGARVVSILNDTDLEAEAEVPSDRLNGLSPGALVTLTLDDNSRHRATVRAVVPTENVRTRTRPVRFTPNFGKTRMRLAADQSITVLIPVGGGRQVATVHKDAVVRGGADAFVFVVEDNLAKRVKVRLGDGMGSRFVVFDGVRPGQKVVVRGNETLGRGGPVRIQGGAGS